MFSEKNKIDKPIARLTKKKNERNQINKKMKGEITTMHSDTKTHNRIPQLYANKLDNIEEMDRFLEIDNCQDRIKKMKFGTSLAVQQLGLHTSTSGTWVQSWSGN